MSTSAGELLPLDLDPEVPEPGSDGVPGELAHGGVAAPPVLYEFLDGDVQLLRHRDRPVDLSAQAVSHP